MDVLPFSIRAKTTGIGDRLFDMAEILSNDPLNKSYIQFNENLVGRYLKYMGIFAELTDFEFDIILVALGFAKNRPDYPLSNGEKIDLLWWLYVTKKIDLPEVIKYKLTKAFKSSNGALLKELRKTYIIDQQTSRIALIFIYVMGRKPPLHIIMDGPRLNAYEASKQKGMSEITKMWAVLIEEGFTTNEVDMEMGPYQWMATKAPNTALILSQINEDNYKEINKHYGLSLPLEELYENSKLKIIKELFDYEKSGVFTRDPNVLNNFPPTGMIANSYRVYTASELMLHYGFMDPYVEKRRELLIYLRHNIPDHPHWAFILTNNSAIGECQNKDYIDPIDQEPLDNIQRKYDWISYGEPGNWRCYPLEYIEESIHGFITKPDGTYELTDAGDAGNVVVRDYDPVFPNNFPPFSDGTKLSETFTWQQIKELYDLIKEVDYDRMVNLILPEEVIRIKGIVEKIVSKFEIILRDQSAKLRMVREQAVLYQSLSDEKKVMVAGYFLTMMLIGLIMRKWKDMSEYPYEWIDRGGDRLTSDERPLLVGHAGVGYFDMREQLLKPENANVKSLTLDLPMVDVKNGTREFNIYTNPSYSPFTEQNNGNMIDVLMRSALAGEFCMGAANKKFIGTAWFYLTQFLGLNDDQFSEYLTRYWRYLKGQGYTLNGVDIFADVKSFPFDISQLSGDWHYDVDEDRAAEQANEI